MRILLIDPPFHRFMGFYRFYFPLGLTYLAAVLKREGHDVYVYDADHDASIRSTSMGEASENYNLYHSGVRDENHPLWQEYVRVIQLYRPDIVGISTLTVKMMSAIKIIQLTKKFDPNIIVICGGEHATARPQDLLSHGAHHIICGEGEDAICQIAKSIKEKEHPQNIIFGKYCEHLDDLPMPDFSSLPNLSSYRPIDLGLMVSARGCPYLCRFCGIANIWGKSVRYHSVERICQEIRFRKMRFGTSYFSFRNGTFSIDRKRVFELCKNILDEQFDIKWECLVRVDTIDTELLNCMMEAGCSTVRIGVESGSEDILQYMGKGITLDEIRTTAQILNKSGIYWSAYFILGVPKETEETVKLTLKLMKEIDPPFITLARYTPFPGTPMYDEVVRAKLLDEKNTEWAWAANSHSADTAFVQNMNPEKFLKLFHETTKWVDAHNARKSQTKSDARLKT